MASDDKPIPLRAYKVELLIIDHDKLGDKGIKDAIIHTNYPNDCISPRVVRLESYEIQWTDDHPLNRHSGWREFYERLFNGDGNQ